MINNNEQLLVVVYWEDIPQFELFCYSLNRFWQGNKKIKIIVSRKVYKEKNKDLIKVNKEKIKKNIESITELYFSDWDYEIIFRKKFSWSSGWTEQQFYKVIESLNTLSNDIIVFDSKDILYKNLYFDDFKNKNYYLIKYRENDANLNEHYSYSYWNIENLPNQILPSNLTPWIWNKNDLFFYTYHLEIKENLSLEDMEFYPGNYEIENYFVFNQHLLKNPEVKYYERKTNIFFYPSENDAENYNKLTSTEKNNYLDNFPTIFSIIKIHRKYSNNKNFKNYIFDILQKYNFPNELIKKWKIETCEYSKNWKNHSDLEYYYYKDKNKY